MFEDAFLQLEDNKIDLSAIFGNTSSGRRN